MDDKLYGFRRARYLLALANEQADLALIVHKIEKGLLDPAEIPDDHLIRIIEYLRTVNSLLKLDYLGRL